MVTPKEERQKGAWYLQAVVRDFDIQDAEAELREQGSSFHLDGFHFPLARRREDSTQRITTACAAASLWLSFVHGTKQYVHKRPVCEISTGVNHCNSFTSQCIHCCNVLCTLQSNTKWNVFTLNSMLGREKYTIMFARMEKTSG